MSEGRLRVLLVDDEAGLRDPLAGFLRDKHSCAVDTAADGASAWALALRAETPYQVALIDDLLPPNAEEEPRPFGVELMKRIKAQAPQTEVIIFTGRGWRLERAREALQAGAFRYLAKTVDREELALIIRHAAEFHRLKGDAREKQILLLASQAAATIELNDKKDQLERLFASSPNAIIAVDAVGSVNSFNKQAEDTLCYRADEILGRPVYDLYIDPQEPRRIGRKLHLSADGRVANYETFVKNKNGQAIPIRLSSTWLYDSGGKRIGSVGYFEDLRPDKERERRIELILEANNIVVQAENMDDGLKSLAEMIDALLDTTFCRIFLLDESKRFLVAKAISLNPRYGEELNWNSGLGERTAVAEWQGLSDTLANSGPLVLRIGGRQSHTVLEEWSRRMGLKKEIQSLLVIPLRIKDKVVGLLDVGELRCWEEAPFTEKKIDLAAAIAGQIVAHVDRIRSHESTERHNRLLRSCFVASNTLVSSRNLQQTLQEIVEQTRIAADASWVRLIRIDETGVKRNRIDVLAVAGEKKDLDVARVVRPDGLSMKVLRDGEPVVIEDVNENLDRLSPFMLQEGGGAAVCLPLSLQGKRIGVVWIHYDNPRHFSESEIDAWRLYVNHAAIAYDGARQVDELEHLSHAAQAMSKVSNLKQTLGAIGEEARKMFDADFSVIWPYDAGRDQFLPDELTAVGYSEMELEKIRELEPQRGRTTYKALREGWIGVQDVSNPAHDGPRRMSGREHLRRSGIVSFQGVVLKVGDEPVGVLYVSYRQPRAFGEEDRRSLKRFAAHAALSLRNAKLLDQVSKAKTAARAVARMTALGDHNKTLNSITKETMEAMRCDAVVLYAYDQDTNKLDHVPVMNGVSYQERVPRYGEVPSASLVYEMLKLDKPRSVENIAGDPLFRNRPFVRDEGIKSCVAIPLRAAEQKVGVMFVNYRSPHRFTSEEITDIELFADQAAVAIRNAQLFEAASQLPGQKALVRLSEKLLGTMKQQEMLDRAVAVAADALGADLASTILLDKSGDLILAATAGCWKGLVVGETRFEGGKGSHTGYTILEKEPVIVADYARETRFTAPPTISKNRIQSGMSVPMLRGNEAVGAMVAFSRGPRLFTEAEKTLLCLIANQTAIALKSAEQYEAIERKRAYLKALFEASKAFTGSFALEPKEVLNCIVRQAVECVIGSQAPTMGFGVVHRYNEATDELICERVYSFQGGPDLSNRMGQRRFLGAGRIGISGRTVKTRSPQLVRNVGNDPDYVDFDPRVKSQVTAPLLDQDRVIGVLSLESEQADAFDEDTQNTLQALAELAVITIRNSEQYKELKETKGLVGSRTALAWTGMISSTWRHTIEMDAITIREEVQLLRSEFARSPESARMSERMAKIERLANRILEKPITPPLSVEDAHSLSINALIRDRTHQLWNNDPYKSVILDLKLGLANSATAHASLEWMRRCLDVLIDNAVDATLGRPDRMIIISSQEVGTEAEISVADNGKGISEEVAAQLFREPVKKLKGARGLGIGLLFAQTIVQTYGGDLRCDSTGPAGTTMTITLPLET